MWYVFLFPFLPLSLIFTLAAPPHRCYEIWCCFSYKKCLLCFSYLALALFLVELRWNVALLSLFLCLSLYLFSKFLDMTINLNLIIWTTQIQKHFLLSVFVFIDSFLVSASQDAGGHTLSLQNNLTFSIGLHAVGVWTVSVQHYVRTKFTFFHRLPILVIELRHSSRAWELG